MHSLFVYGAGGFGREIMDAARRCQAALQKWTNVYFIDDFCSDDTRYGARVFSFDAACTWMQSESGEVVIATGEPAARMQMRERVEASQIPLGQVLDPSVIVATTAQLAVGVVIAPLCSISSNACLHTNAVVNTLSIVGHDVVVSENAVISSMVNLGGNCQIGRNSYIGMGTLIKEGVRIGEDAIVGMGSVVYHDIPDQMIALGNPARPMRRNDDKKVFK
jgi:sugar O-acyltransferase (sialic acid O-acetyltransferase NeuD family)